MVLLSTTTACAELSRWNHYYDSARQAERRGDSALADDLYAKSVSDAKTFGVSADEYLPALITHAQTRHDPALWKEALNVAKTSKTNKYITEIYVGYTADLDFHGKRAEALNAANEFIEVTATQFGVDSREHATALFSQAFELRNNNRGKEALAAIKKAKPILLAQKFDRKNDTLVDLYEVEADSFDQIGDKTNAVKAYSEASRLARDPFYRNTHANFARLLHKYGMEAEARKEYKAYLRNADESPAIPRPLPTYEQFISR